MIVMVVVLLSRSSSPQERSQLANVAFIARGGVLICEQEACAQKTTIFFILFSAYIVFTSDWHAE